MKKTFFVSAVSMAALASSLVFAHADGPSDAQIAGIVVVANTVDIDAGKLAQNKSKNKDVRSFAKRMVVDHTGVNAQASALVGKLKVIPEESETSRALKTGGDQMLAKLKGLDGAAFDKAYVDNEVTYHQTVLDALDNTLIPGAKNPELKQLLVKVRPAIAAHLEHARHMQAAMR